SACLAAWRLDNGAQWTAGAMRAFDWFLGSNDLQTSLVETNGGGCLRGFTPIVQMRVEVRSRQFPPFSVLPRCVSSHALLGRQRPPTSPEFASERLNVCQARATNA